MSWKQEEIEAHNFLTNLELKNIIFQDFGKHDSNTPDIKVLKNGKFIFNAEVKMNKAQSSQFVIEKFENKFKFSNKNKTENNEYKIKILEYLNTHFNKYENVSSSGIEVKCEKFIGYGHIISDFKSKSIRYIITRTKFSNFKIIHINNFKNFFDIKCILRNKKSGSSPISKNNIDGVSDYVLKKFNASSINIVDPKKFLFKSETKNLLGHYFNIENDQYFISKQKYNNFFRVNRTSKTNNPNVIFEIQLISHDKNDDIKLFLDDLNS